MYFHTRNTSKKPIVILLTKLSLNFKTQHCVYCTIYKEGVLTALDNPKFHGRISYMSTSQTWHCCRIASFCIYTISLSSQTGPISYEGLCFLCLPVSLSCTWTSQFSGYETLYRRWNGFCLKFVIKKMDRVKLDCSRWSQLQVGNRRDFASDRQFNMSQRTRRLCCQVLLSSSGVTKPGPRPEFKSISVTCILSA